MFETYTLGYCSHHKDDLEELHSAAEFAYNSSATDDFGRSPFELDVR